jgi:hypothetical protein
MRTERWSWWNATLAIALLSLTGQGAWSPDPEYALLGRTGAMPQNYEVSASGPAISGEQALLAKISENGVRVAAKEGNRITAVVALLGR